MKNIEKILAGFIFCTSALFIGCHENVSLKYRDPTDKIIKSHRNEFISTCANFSSTTNINTIEKTINDVIQPVNAEVLGSERTYHIEIKEELKFDIIGVYELKYYVSNSQDSSSAKWTINIENYKPEIFFNNDTSTSIIRVTNPIFPYKINTVDKDEMDPPLVNNVKIKFHNKFIKNLSLEENLEFGSPGTYQLEITSSDGIDVVEREIEIVYANNSYFDYSQVYNDQTGVLDINNLLMFSNLIQKYYSKTDIRLIDNWNNFLNSVSPQRIIYDTERKTLDYISNNYEEDILISSNNLDLTNSLNNLSNNFSNSKLEDILMGFVPENSTISKNKVLTFENNSSVFKNLNLDYYISYLGGNFGVKSNPTNNEKEIINDYNNIFGENSKIIMMNNDETVFDSLLKLYNYLN